MFSEMNAPAHKFPYLMGSSSSTVDVPGGGTDGYHVLHVLPNSPGHRAGLDPFFDFIVCINGIRLVLCPSPFAS
jgi:hypothetical protein